MHTTSTCHSQIWGAVSYLTTNNGIIAQLTTTAISEMEMLEPSTFLVLSTFRPVHVVTLWSHDVRRHTLLQLLQNVLYLFNTLAWSFNHVAKVSKFSSFHICQQCCCNLGFLPQIQKIVLITFFILVVVKRLADKGRSDATPWPRLTARLQRSAGRRLLSVRSWSTHLLRGRPGWRRHWLLGGRPSDRLMWQLSALWAGTSSGSLATWPKRALRRWLMVSEMDRRPVVAEMSSFRMNWCHLMCSSCLWHFTLHMKGLWNRWREETKFRLHIIIQTAPGHIRSEFVFLLRSNGFCFSTYFIINKR